MAESGNESQPFITCGLGQKEPLDYTGISTPQSFQSKTSTRQTNLVLANMGLLSLQWLTILTRSLVTLSGRREEGKTAVNR